MAAVRVPPSACSTSQSSRMLRSPNTARSTTDRNERPISRWISMVRPDARPFETSRGVRVAVARGSIEYSAVTQPLPDPRMKPGTLSSIEAAHNTRVLPTSIKAEPFRGKQVVRGHFHRPHLVRFSSVRFAFIFLISSTSVTSIKISAQKPDHQNRAGYPARFERAVLGRRDLGGLNFAISICALSRAWQPA